MPQLRNFSGALNTRIDASLISGTEAREYTNIESDTAVLTPVKDSVLAVSNALQFAYFSVTDQEWQFASTPTDWVEFKEVLYTGNRTAAPTKKVGGVEYKLGIDRPVGTISLVADSAAPSVTEVSFAGSATGGDLTPDATFKYKIVSRSVGVESLDYLTEEIETSRANAQSTTLNSKTTRWRGANTIVSDDTVTISVESHLATDYRAYRNLDGVWYAVSDTWTTIGVDLVDSVLDISANEELVLITGIDGTIQYVVTYYSSITGAESAPLLTSEVEVEVGSISLSNIPVSTDSQVDTVRIYRVGGNITVFTLVDTITNGTTTYNDVILDVDVEGSLLQSADYDPAPTGLKFLVEAYAMLFGAVGDQLRFTPIGIPDAWPVEFFLDFPEPVTGISRTSIGLLVHTLFKTYLVTGTGPTALAQQTLSGSQGCVSHDSIVETEDSALWVSTDGVCVSDGSNVKVLTRDKLGKLSLDVVASAIYDEVYYVQLVNGSTFAVDFERSQFKYFEYNVDSVVIANDIFYGHRSGALYALETADTSLSMSYTSPDLIGGGLNTPKLYKDITIFSSGTVNIEIFVNGVLAATYTRTTEDSHELKLPKDFTRGFYIRFRVTGTGEVRSIDWKDNVANG